MRMFPEETRICVDRLSKDRLPSAGGCHPTWEGLEWNKKAPSLCRTNLQVGSSLQVPGQLLQTKAPGLPDTRLASMKLVSRYTPVVTSDLSAPPDPGSSPVHIKPCARSITASARTTSVIQVHPCGPKYQACHLLIWHQDSLPENSSRKPAQW